MGETDLALCSATYSNQYFSVLFVHSSGPALVVKALGSLAQWIVYYIPDGVPCHCVHIFFLKNLQGDREVYVTVRIWESLSQ